MTQTRNYKKDTVPQTWALEQWLPLAEAHFKENPGDFVGKGIITGKKKKTKKDFLCPVARWSDKVTVISLDA